MFLNFSWAFSSLEINSACKLARTVQIKFIPSEHILITFLMSLLDSVTDRTEKGFQLNEKHAVVFTAIIAIITAVCFQNGKARSFT